MYHKTEFKWMLAALTLFIMPTVMAMTPVRPLAQSLWQTPKLHPDARRDMRTALLALDQAGKNLDGMDAAANLEDKQALLKRTRFQLDRAIGDLKSSKREAEKRGQGNHPEYAQAAQRLEALEKRYLLEQHKIQALERRGQAAVAGIADAARELKTEYDRLYNFIFSKASGTAIYHHAIAEVGVFLSTVEAFEKNDLNRARAMLEAFLKRLGTTDAEAIDQKAIADGWKDTNYRASYAVGKMQEGIANVAKTRVAMALDMLARAGQYRQMVQGSADFARVERYQMVQSYLQYAVKFDPKNTAAQTELAGYEAWRDADWKAFGRKIDARKFPGPVNASPKNASSLAKTAMAWFADSLDWGKRNQSTTAKDKEPRRVITVAVVGPWSVQARDIRGRITMHGLPVKLVVALDSEKHLNVYRVYELTMRTQERPGVAAAPPFDSITVGNSYYIRASAVSK